MRTLVYFLNSVLRHRTKTIVFLAAWCKILYFPALCIFPWLRRNELSIVRLILSSSELCDNLNTELLNKVQKITDFSSTVLFHMHDVLEIKICNISNYSIVLSTYNILALPSWFVCIRGLYTIFQYYTGWTSFNPWNFTGGNYVEK